MAPKKKAAVDAPRGKRTSAAGFSALALLSGADLPSARPTSPDTAAQKKKPKKSAPKKRAAPASAPPPAPSAAVSGRPKPTPQRERADRPAVGASVRVWWPPTRDPAKTGFSGAYWPAKVVPGPAGGDPAAAWATVKYDNGEKGRALLDDLFPASPPVDFGEERDAIKPGEFVEVHNGSSSDPCAWVGVARKVGVRAAEAVVSYPFHDAEDETVPLSRVRRARVWEAAAWQLPRPGQRWQPGEVTSPRELELLPEREYARRVLGGGGNGGGNGGGAEANGGGKGNGKGNGKAAAAGAAAKNKGKAAAAPAPRPKAAASPKPKPNAAAKSPKKKKAAPPPPKAKKAAASAGGKKPVGRPPKK